MRKITYGRMALIALGGLASALTLSMTVGQAPPPRTLPPQLLDDNKSTSGVPDSVKAASAAASPLPAQPGRRAAPYDRLRKLDALPEETRQLVMTALKGMEWLNRYNQSNGLFLHGYFPAVNQTLEGDDFLHQSMAAFALARAARFTGDERYLVHANQAILTLLTRTKLEAGVRHPEQPSVFCNRLAMAGFLALAIYELPDAAPDLIQKAEELCHFIRRQQRDDGSLSYVDSPADNPLTADPDGVNKYPGPALYALAVSRRAKPAAWKVEARSKAITYYRKYFKDHPHPEFVPWMTAACADAYISSKESPCAEFAFEMNDWLCGLQYVEAANPRQILWRGGFKRVANGRIELTAPGVESALYAQSLADCCRFIRQMQSPDLQRYDRYRAALVSSLNFVSTLQFTEANTLHVSSNYRELLVGGFHPTQIDGNLRIDQGATAVSAFVQFFVSGADKAQ